MSKKSYSHVLQKVGVLKNFTVAKIVSQREINELKKLIRSMTDDDVEYRKILDEEMSKISNMHDTTNPIPGIIYPKDNSAFQKMVFEVTRKFCSAVHKQKMSKEDMAFLITAIINELGLTQEDFMNLKSELEDDASDDEDDEDDKTPPTF